MLETTGVATPVIHIRPVRVVWLREHPVGCHPQLLMFDPAGHAATRLHQRRTVLCRNFIGKRTFT